MGLIVNMAFFLISFHYSLKSYFYFRRGGGRKGLRKFGSNEALPEEQFVNKAGMIAEKGVNSVDKRLENAIYRQKFRDKLDDIELQRRKKLLM
mmetsp:Transcript_12781/g.21608  ORF Transcript_12781/g.21608 Transcript_12781/m.21608 type:complete len:93 (-) Transcript_12781:38-316(-)